jgi:hypothetical protein
VSISFDIKMTNTVTPMLKRIQAKLALLPQQAYKEFVAITPIDKGNARRKTHLSGKTIKADYPYAKRLDEGYSKQAPDGMVNPISIFIKKRIAQIVRGK